MELRQVQKEEMKRFKEIRRAVKNLNDRGIGLAEVLKELRTLYCTNYSEMAAIIGVTNGRISNIVNKQRNTTETVFIKYLFMLDQTLNIDLKELKKQWD